MAPKGLAILLGAGPATGAGIARVLSHPAQGNMQSLRASHSDAIIEAFPTDTKPENLRKTFQEIRQHSSFQDLKLKVAIFSVKNSSKKPFMQETFDEFMAPLESYVGGAMIFSQESIKLMLEHHGEKSLAEGGEKKGTIIFTGTLGALRCNAEFASYGASRSSVRQPAQALAREMSPRGIHVAHAIANGRIVDADSEDTRAGRHIAAEAVGQTYLYLHNQHPTLWTHELDLRPAQEKF
ncbi:hypothetical protein CERZMDRAFT_110368 [Cercospora zeae-maydis SCOH1-5]|uniref:Short-chain dehydrogenase/reductase SDR n=1 Tax=Cercospora zeae-maydis SCOH1-5 TaxID=717836 RepID=A0A6A6FN10_9PEZI|nr:hypothetical protein CERZMDRAFT_110368 [Cercospora zeae-maydis SCOH1-5]